MVSERFQRKHYARLALIAEDNPDLPLSMIQGILEAQAELRAGLGEPYQWGVMEPHKLVVEMKLLERRLTHYEEKHSALSEDFYRALTVGQLSHYDE